MESNKKWREAIGNWKVQIVKTTGRPLSNWTWLSVRDLYSIIVLILMVGSIFGFIEYGHVDLRYFMGCPLFPSCDEPGYFSHKFSSFSLSLRIKMYVEYCV